MAQPTPYERSFSFTDFSSATPQAQQPGARFDAEFDNLAATLGGVLTNLTLIQRDDGRLANGSVGLDQLGGTVIALLARLGADVHVWSSGTNYTPGDFVIDGTIVYLTKVAHTAAADIGDDIAAENLVRIFDPDAQGVEPRVEVLEEFKATLLASTGAATVLAASGESVEAELTKRVTHLASKDAVADYGSAHGTAYLDEDGCEGLFKWNGSELSDEVTADTERGIYIPPSSDTSGASGAWVREIEGQTAYASWFGITAATTSASAISTSMNAAVLASCVIWVFQQGDYSIDGQIDCPTEIDWIDLRGSRFTLAAAAGYLFNYDAGLTALPAMTVDLNSGDSLFTFASAHGLVQGDAFLVVNATSYSLDGWRSVYKDGQACIVHAANTDKTLTIRGVADPRGHQRQYPAAECALFKYGKQRGVTICDGVFDAGALATTTLRIYGVAGPRLLNVKTLGGTAHSIQVNKCAYGYDENCDFSCNGTAVSTQYGMSAANSGPWTSINSRFYGSRHAFSAGGDSSDGNIPCRNWTFINPQFDSKDWLSFDTGHANNLDFVVVAGRASNGINLGGSGHNLHFTRVNACTQIASNNFVLASELHGSRHKIRIDRAYVPGTGFDGVSNENDGMIGIGGSGNGLAGLSAGGNSPSATIAGTIEPGEFEIEIGHIDAPNWNNASAQVMIVRNRGFTGHWSVRHRIGHITMQSESSILRYATVSGAEARKITIDGVPNRHNPGGGAHGWTSLPWTFATGTPIEVALPPLYGSKVQDWADLATATQQSTTVTVTGAALGDLVDVSMSVALNGTRLWGEVTAANTVTVYHRNDTGVNVNLASGTLRVTVQKPRA